ncbi:ribosomal protein S5-alanine N-acetyltransferase [Vibrio penaeicida]|uniref:ribosomal protein S5-alanine N-acetyltransferase n=1 Tax=Vibrio penaeicida TaxID=104609 RepID=UPI000CE9F370|nr:ribosomal protein S5-alanine N-acetyltransferase [Vibrio penaeicida]
MSSYIMHASCNGVIVRTAEPGDAKKISEYFRRNKAHLKPWEPKREEAFFREDGWAQRLIKLHELHRMGLAFYLLIVDEETDEMMGTVSFSNVSRHPFHACNVGYSVAEYHQGKGVMKTALKLSCDWLFENQNLHRIMAAYIPTNQRSEGVLKHLGFQLEGTAKDYLLIDGKWRDHNLTSLINPNWREKPDYSN